MLIRAQIAVFALFLTAYAGAASPNLLINNNFDANPANAGTFNLDNWFCLRCGQSGSGVVNTVSRSATQSVQLNMPPSGTEVSYLQDYVWPGNVCTFTFCIWMNGSSPDPGSGADMSIEARSGSTWPAASTKLTAFVYSVVNGGQIINTGGIWNQYCVSIPYSVLPPGTNFIRCYFWANPWFTNGAGTFYYDDPSLTTSSCTTPTPTPGPCDNQSAALDAMATGGATWTGETGTAATLTTEAVADDASSVRMEGGDQYWWDMQNSSGMSDLTKPITGVDAKITWWGNNCACNQLDLDFSVDGTVNGLISPNAHLNNSGFGGGGTAAFQGTSTYTLPAPSGGWTWAKVDALRLFLRNTSSMAWPQDRAWVNHIALSVHYAPVCGTPTPTSTPTFTATLTHTKTNSPTPTSSPTLTATPTATLTRSPTPSITLTHTPTLTPTPTATQSWTPTLTASPTPTLTRSPTPTSSHSPTLTHTPTLTHSPTVTLTWSPTLTATASQTLTSSPTPTLSSSPTLTRTPTATLTHTPTTSPTPTVTLTPSPTSTPTYSLSPTSTFTASPTPTFSATRTATLTASPTFSHTRTITPGSTPTFTLTLTLTPTATSTLTSSPTPSVTLTPSPTLTPTFTVTRTDTPTITPSSTLSSSPTLTFTHTKTVTPGSTPTFTLTPSWTLTRTATQTHTPTLTVSPTPSYSATQTATRTATLTETPTLSVSPTSSHTKTITPGPSPTFTLTLTSSPTPTHTPTSSPSATVTLSFTPPATPSWTATPSLTFTATLTRSFTSTFTATQTSTPSMTPSPTATRTATPSQTPTFSDTPTPTQSFTFSPTPTPQPGIHGSARVFNSAGEEVALLADGLGFYTQPQGLKAQLSAFVPDASQSMPLSVMGTSFAFSWDGANSQGQLVDAGAYTVLLSVKDQFGAITSYTVQVTVIRSPESIEVSVFNSAGERVKQAALPLSPSSTLDNFVWDQKDDAGKTVAQGTYVAVLTRHSQSGVSVQSKSLTVLYGPDPGLPAPRLVLLGPDSFLIRSGAADSKARVYNVAGELVRLAAASSANGDMRVDLNGFAAGIYVIIVENQGPLGPRRTLLKWALSR